MYVLFTHFLVGILRHGFQSCTKVEASNKCCPGSRTCSQSVKWFQCLQSPNHFHPCPDYGCLPTNQINASVNLHFSAPKLLCERFLIHITLPFGGWSMTFFCISLRLNNSFVPVYDVESLADMRFSHGSCFCSIV